MGRLNNSYSSSFFKNKDFLLNILFLFFFLEEEKKKLILEVVGVKLNAFSKNLIICSFGIILSGLPPFPIFFLKLVILFYITKILNLLILILLYFSACLRVYFYSNI